VIGEVELPEKVFGVAIDHDLLQQAAMAQLANRRQVLAHTKDRSEVSGGGKKPWRQKGTGRARHGSIRSPIWKGGGVAFGPSKDRNFSVKINKKVKRKAIFMALSGKVKDQQIVVLDGVALSEAKTKILLAILKIVAGKLTGYRSSKTKQDSVLMVSARNDGKLIRAINNIGFAKALDAKSLNVLDLLSYKYILLTKDAIPIIEETYKI
jgi:large subunit ribosomal protein L4